MRHKGGLVWAKSTLWPSFMLPWPHLYSPAFVHALPLFLLPYTCPIAPAADAAPFIALWLFLLLLPLLVRVRAPSVSSLALVCPPWPLVHVCPPSSVCSTIPVKAKLVFFNRKLYLPLHLRPKIPIKQMDSWLSSFTYCALSCGGGERQDVAWLA